MVTLILGLPDVRLGENVVFIISHHLQGEVDGQANDLGSTWLAINSPLDPWLSKWSPDVTRAVEDPGR